MNSLWRKAPALAVWPLLAFALFHSVPLHAGCDQMQAGQTLRLRLLQPVSSYSAKPGQPVRAIVVQSPVCDGLPFFEDGTEISGRIKAVHRVGMGFRHEAASIDLEFDWISPDVGPSSRISSQVISVDDARETVKKGVIHGITPGDSPQDQILVPIPLSHLAAWTPYSYWMTPVFKAVFPIAPEPEIYFPAGTDLRIELTAPLLINETGTAPIDPEFPAASRQALAQLIATYPERSTNSKGLEADVVNLIFLGTDEQIANAFRIAGWVDSDPLSAHSIWKGVHAVFASKSDPTLPMAHHLLSGQPSDFALEKSLDSYSKRDHLRIWSSADNFEGQSVWLSAATAEVGATWSLRRGKFVHDVNPNVDEEREKIVRDLTLSGCVSNAYNVPRADMPRVMLSTSDTPLRTDGAVAVVRLTDCTRPFSEELADSTVPAIRPQTRFARLVRTEVLSLRNVWRDNPVYTSYELARVTAHAFPRKRDRNGNGAILANADVSSSPNAQ